jgi:hypothetical protein
VLEVRLDPRVLAEGLGEDEVREQERIALGIRDQLSRARALAARIVRLRDGADAGERERFDALRELLVARGGAYPQPRLIEQLQYLAGIVDGADQRPGRDVGERLAEWTAALDEIERALD